MTLTARDGSFPKTAEDALFKDKLRLTNPKARTDIIGVLDHECRRNAARIEAVAKAWAANPGGPKPTLPVKTVDDVTVVTMKNELKLMLSGQDLKDVATLREGGPTAKFTVERDFTDSTGKQHRAGDPRHLSAATMLIFNNGGALRDRGQGRMGMDALPSGPGPRMVTLDLDVLRENAQRTNHPHHMLIALKGAIEDTKKTIVLLPALKERLEKRSSSMER